MANAHASASELVPPPSAVHPSIVVLDFGSQFTMLIARRIRELDTYCEVLPFNVDRGRIEKMDVRGVVLSGGPNSVYDEEAPHAPDWVWELGVPVLGICYGMQLLAHQLGGRVGPGMEREFGPATIRATTESALLKGLPAELDVWMSHGDRIEVVPPGFEPVATSANSPFAVMADLQRGYYGLQFHPEVVHTPRGLDMLRNFLHEVCELKGDWTGGPFYRRNRSNLFANRWATDM